MKTVILTLGFCIISIVNFAQINLEHTFSGPDNCTQINTNNQTMYFNYNSTTGVLNLFNNDYSYYKSITITPPAGYQLYASNFVTLYYTISTKVFNTDDQVEFASVFQSTGTPTTYKLLLYNENFQIIKDFGERISISVFKTVNNETKCIVGGFTLSGSQITYYQDIYHLPGNLPSDVPNVILTSDEDMPFPNPTNTYIIIPLSIGGGESSILNIFNQQGQMIDSRKINWNETSIRYDVQSLSPGLYFYQYNNVKEKFIVIR